MHPLPQFRDSFYYPRPFFTMGFDQNDNQPIVVPAKRTTKVNIGIIAGVLVFFGAGALGIAWIWHHQDENAQNVQQNLSQPKSP